MKNKIVKIKSYKKDRDEYLISLIKEYSEGLFTVSKNELALLRYCLSQTKSFTLPNSKKQYDLLEDDEIRWIAKIITSYMKDGKIKFGMDDKQHLTCYLNDDMNIIRVSLFDSVEIHESEKHIELKKIRIEWAGNWRVQLRDMIEHYRTYCFNGGKLHSREWFERSVNIGEQPVWANLFDNSRFSDKSTEEVMKMVDEESKFEIRKFMDFYEDNANVVENELKAYNEESYRHGKNSRI